MFKALWTASTGMKAQMTKLNVIANNMANVNTIGFKKSRAEFKDLLYQTLEEAGATKGNDAYQPVGQQVGVGTALSAIVKEFSMGSLERTDRELDVAIKGHGFFRITGPDGQDAYTRDGSFKLSSDGSLVNSDGYKLADGGVIPNTARSIQFGPDGTISYIDQNGGQANLGQIQLAMFANPSGLNAIGGNLYKESPASGAAALTGPGLASAGTIEQFVLETSNVSVIDEMVNMIETQRAYEINSKMIRASDEMLSTANQIS
ncbi:MAG: flagellar basal-body rod protein FlgG [Chlamydiales bacterium]|jgi:flagellar basal-body rod protein FlgG|nr:flagellar basal-body rod protein FlgG [Chlamydiales bacterium]